MGCAHVPDGNIAAHVEYQFQHKLSSVHCVLLLLQLRLLPGAGSSQPQPYIIRKLHAEQHEMTSDVSVTSFQFTLPSSATPSFRTPVVALRWVLRFEFTVGPPLNWSAPDRARAGQGKAVMSQLMWSLPLVVRPPTVLRS